jgi:hypothetical protein
MPPPPAKIDLFDISCRQIIVMTTAAAGRRRARIVVPGRAARQKALGLVAGAIEHMQRMTGGEDVPMCAPIRPSPMKATDARPASPCSGRAVIREDTWD